MAEVKLYIYNGDMKGGGITLTSSRIFTLDDRAVTTEGGFDNYVSPLAKFGMPPHISVKRQTIFQYEVTLTKLEYRKKVYEPCEILASLQLGIIQKRTDVTVTETTKSPDGKDYKEEKTIEGHFEPVEFVSNDEIDLLKSAKVCLEIDGNTVAENYYVHKVRSVYKTVSGKTSMFVELAIYSADKRMTLDKYSRAYTAKKLYTDILSGEAEKFILKDAEKEEDRITMGTLIANHMQLLKYEYTTNSTTSRDELRIPYLVQYNESFYQFLVRCANRFGEYLYFEDGKLNLGMQPSETNYYKRNAKGEIEKTSDGSEIIIDWATEPNAVQKRYYESAVSEGISVEDRSYSYMTHTPEGEGLYADSADSRYNLDPVSANEWTSPQLTKNEYIGFDEAWEEEMKVFCAEIIFTALESTTISEAITALILQFIKKTYDARRNNKDYNNLLDESNYDVVEDDQKSGDDFKEFVSYSGSSNLSSNLQQMFAKSGIDNYTDLFYQVIRKNEKEIGEKAVYLDFGNYYKPIKLGDKLRVNGVDYVAISVEGSYENGMEHLLVSALPVLSLSTTITPQIASSSGDSWTATIPFPPSLPDVVIRDARPQMAFVAGTLDPSNMGRIRVRYPWQDKEGDASPWIRVTLPLATRGGSVNFTPSEGDEVMVGYEHGNIERPYAMGYMVAPFVNETWKNAIPLDQYGGLHGIKVKTGHHLTFTDGANAATLIASLFGPFNFLKSMWPTGWWGAWPLGNATSSDLGGGFELSDRYGFYKITGSTDDRNITIESPVGTVEMKAFQGISISAPNGNIEIKGKNVSIEAGNRLTIEAGKNIEDKLWYREKFSNTKAGWKAGLKGTALTEGKEALMALKSNVLDQILDMSFIRCVLEWFLVPVNGTLQIKSGTFVKIEAGEGSAEVPQESLRYGKGINDDLEALQKVIASAKCIETHVTSLIKGIQQNYHKVYLETLSFMSISDSYGFNTDESAIDYATVIAKGETEFTEESDFTWGGADTNDLELKNPEPVTEPDKDSEDYKTSGQFDKKKYDAAKSEYDKKLQLYYKEKARDTLRKKKRAIIVDRANLLRIAANNLKNAVSKLTDFKKADFVIAGLGLPPGLDSADKLDLGTIADKIKDLTLPTDKGFGVSFDEMKDCTYDNTIKKIKDSKWKDLISAMSRYVMSQYLSDQDVLELDDGKITSLSDAYNNTKWKEFVASIELSDSDSFMDKFNNKGNELFNPFYGFIDDQLQWSHGFKGKILLSDNSNKTAYFDEGLNMKPHHNRTSYKEDIKTLRVNLAKL